MDCRKHGDAYAAAKNVGPHVPSDGRRTHRNQSISILLKMFLHDIAKRSRHPHIALDHVLPSE